MGTGFAESDLKRVFDPFYSTKPGGMGIGLAICQSIVAAHHGSITATNNPEGGTTFCVSLPVEQRDMTEASAAPTIFLVDDDPGVLKALSRVLREDGWSVETFESAEAFLARPDQKADGCLVLDVTMPGLDGLELQRRLAGAGESLPIVFISGHGDIPMSVRAIKAGATDFLTKPVEAEALVAAVRAAIEQHAATRRALADAAELRQRLASLTPRERDVLAGAGGGKAQQADRRGPGRGRADRQVPPGPHHGPDAGKDQRGADDIAGRLGIGAATAPRTAAPAPPPRANRPPANPRSRPQAVGRGIDRATNPKVSYGPARDRRNVCRRDK